VGRGAMQAVEIGHRRARMSGEIDVTKSSS